MPEPAARPGEALLAVEAIAICGSDLHMYRTGLAAGEPIASPIVLGHEVAAVIESLSRPHPTLREGMRVALEPAIPCMNCDDCRRGDTNVCPSIRFLGLPDTHGAMRAKMTHPVDLLFPVDPKLSPAEVALLEPLAVAVYSADLAGLSSGLSVAVVGLGAIGMMLVQLCRLAGCRVFACDPVPERVELTRRFEPDEALVCSASDAIGAVTDWSDGRGAGVVFEAAGPEDAMLASVEMAAPLARVMAVGIQESDRIAFRAATARRKSLAVVFVRRSKGTLARAHDLVADGRVDLASMASHTFDLSGVDEAFTLADKYADGAVRIIIEPM